MASTDLVSVSEEMINCYKEIYGEFYSFDKKWVDSSVELLEKNLSDCNINNEAIKEKIIFNIGTGREVLAFHKLGARKIYHADISDISVKNLNQLALGSNQLSNIDSRKMDVCTDEFKFNKEVQFDLVYLNGVFHHFHSPEIFLDNINQHLNKNSIIFLRIYRSGSLGFFVTDFLRKIKEKKSWNREQFIEIAKKYYSNTNDPRGLYADFYDDLMVPVLNLFNTFELEKYFNAMGFSLENRDALLSDYDHSGGDPAIQGRTLIFKKLSNTAFKNTKNIRLITHVDQMRDINYLEKFIDKTISLMSNALSLCEKELTNEQVLILLRLYEDSQTYRIKKRTTSEENHSLAQYHLLDFINSFHK